MAAKYDPLRDALTSSLGPVTWSFGELDQLVNGLPQSARKHLAWWSNTWASSNVQAHSWLSAGYTVHAVDLNTATATFTPGAPPRPTTRPPGRRMRGDDAVFDGVQQLEQLLRRAGYTTVVAAVAEHTVFLHPDTVRQATGNAVLPVIRNMFRRGEFDTLPDGRAVLLDDNTSPMLCFLWAARRRKGADVQFNHVWNDSANPDVYTALWNLCATPAFLAKTTDGSNHPEVVAALRYRAWDLYEARPAGQPEPPRPSGFADLVWAPHPEPVADLEANLRARLRTNPRSRPALAARTIGWLFSDGHPDTSV